MEPGGFALLDGDASVDSGLREIHVLRAWGLDSIFVKKIVLFVSYF